MQQMDKIEVSEILQILHQVKDFGLVLQNHKIPLLCSLKIFKTKPEFLYTTNLPLFLRKYQCWYRDKLNIPYVCSIYVDNY